MWAQSCVGDPGLEGFHHGAYTQGVQTRSGFQRVMQTWSRQSSMLHQRLTKHNILYSDSRSASDAETAVGKCFGQLINQNMTVSHLELDADAGFVN